MATGSARYWVDWEEKDFPDIRLATSVPVNVQLKTFLECKREITQHFTEQLAHNKLMLRRVKELRVRDVQ
jgi:hypothetical protein